MMLLYLSNTNKSFRLDNILNKQKNKFNEILAIERGEPLISIGSWCLMGNHFHLLVRQETDGGITRFMRKVGVGYSMYFNIRYERRGALFGGLFKSKLIGVDDNYMKQLFGYIHINPLEMKFPDWKNQLSRPTVDMKKFLESYRYSSYVDHIGENRIEKSIIYTKNFPSYFKTQKSFADFVSNYFIKA